MKTPEPGCDSPIVPEALAPLIDSLSRRRGLTGDDLAELADHLRSEYDELQGLGLSPAEAALIVDHRFGAGEELASEYLLAHPERAWRRLDEDAERPAWHLPAALGIGLVAGVLTRLFAEFAPADRTELLMRSVFLIPLALLAVYLAATARSRDARGLALLGTAVAAGAGIAIAYPGDPNGQTVFLTMIHLPVLVLVLVGIAYLGARWRSLEAWMDWVRFLGEGAIYYILTALGGGVVIALITAVFAAIGIETNGPYGTVLSWLIPICAVGALFVCAWLVELKKSAMENVAPVLTAVFTPVMTIALLSFLVVIAVTGNPIEANREILIVFDVLLIVVEAIVIFTVSARPSELRVRALDWMQMALIVAGIVVDLLLLWALGGRVVEYGASANKLAALGVNILLLIHLVGALVGYGRLARGRGSLALERWQSAALPVFAVWAGIVAFVFPLVFRFA
ncbi:permease prefix domain 1-containing protein [Schaalia hyovaginalis]|uniref:permease prefix domain 1-containing protein n=1 Tax=Schaalia hyovaginalis TaxID=29316 RepID=UPI002A758B88|nr:permease prefix domain 1-containing protein [Schaalia hyovaginalis]MDY2669622.1 permease prefix domain 1-containing protein [Schaalia hyovaginalis]